jgi:hypothetical protein
LGIRPSKDVAQQDHSHFWRSAHRQHLSCSPYGPGAFSNEFHPQKNALVGTGEGTWLGWPIVSSKQGSYPRDAEQ